MKKLIALGIMVTCSALSTGNPTLYRPDGHGGVTCADWSEARCVYVARPCRSDELTQLCKFVQWACEKPVVTPRPPTTTLRKRVSPHP